MKEKITLCGDNCIECPRYNAHSVEFLVEKKVKTIAVVGLQTDYCIDATIKCGFEHGFKMIVPENANSTFDNSFMTGEQSYKYYREIFDG